jgi:hypothetical protein
LLEEKINLKEKSPPFPAGLLVSKQQLLDPDLRPEFELASRQPRETEQAEQASSKQLKRAGFRNDGGAFDRECGSPMART